MKIKNLSVMFLLVVFDQLIKFISVKFLKPLSSVEIIKDFFYLTYVENRGIAFGIFQGGARFFAVVSIFILGICFYYYKKLPNDKYIKFNKLALCLIISGAIGNLIDRVFKGYVVDMFHFILFKRDFPVFNLADIFVVTGTFLIIFIMILSEDKKKMRKSFENGDS